MATKDPNTFIFEFEILSRTHDYNNSAQMLISFPSASKKSFLWWFMDLDGHNIQI